MGYTAFDFNFEHRTIKETPTFGDVTKSSSGLEMVISGGESGLIYSSKSELHMVPSDLNWNELYLGEDVCFDIFNPETTNDMIAVEASCLHPDGKYKAVTSKLAGHYSQILHQGKSSIIYSFQSKSLLIRVIVR